MNSDHVMTGIYLGAYRAFHPGYDIVYQDINGLRDIPGDMLHIDLDPYDFIIATPPCNFYSRARGSRSPSQYALDTAHLLPDILKKLYRSDKPFIIENVRNSRVFSNLGLLNLDHCFIYFIGRHTYWTNVMFNTFVNQDIEYILYAKHVDREGGYNVHNVIESWLKEIHSNQFHILR